MGEGLQTHSPIRQRLPGQRVLLPSNLSFCGHLEGQVEQVQTVLVLTLEELGLHSTKRIELALTDSNACAITGTDALRDFRTAASALQGLHMKHGHSEFYKLKRYKQPAQTVGTGLLLETLQGTWGLRKCAQIYPHFTLVNSAKVYELMILHFLPSTGAPLQI